MSTMALQIPDFSRIRTYGLRGHYRHFISRRKIASSMSTSTNEQRQYLGDPPKLPIPETGPISRSNIKFHSIDHGDTPEFTQFVVCEARLGQEYWEFNEMKKRYNTPVGEMCKCTVMVNKSIVVGTLDLSIQHFSHGQAFPGECVKPPLFCLVGRKASSSYGYIANLCVTKSTRSRGVAGDMLQYAILSAKSHGAEKVYVHVHRNNKPALILYEKMGFQVVDVATAQLWADQTYLLCFDSSGY